MKKNKKLFLITSLALVLASCKQLDDIKTEVNKIEIITDTDEIEVITNIDANEKIEEIPEINEEVIHETTEEISNTEITEVVDDNYIDCNDYVFVNDNVNIYEEPNYESNIISNLEIYNKVFRIESDGTWDLVQYNDVTGYIENIYNTPVGDTYVEVDISDQTVWFYKNNELLTTSSIVTGNDSSSPTRIGWFSMYGRRTNTYLTGPGYRSYVNYWMPFDGGIGLHDADGWRSEYGGEIYKGDGSHGCVNMPFETAETIYNNTSNGSKVLVHK